LFPAGGRSLHLPRLRPQNRVLKAAGARH
jgi:hypothetical protein